ncbi:major facilitator superfamily domain-containing protein [Roridomyces roridus]|uniref:Major facilitator superfamily domain-containing protein n=1 Tax=Roridomyces roridus TaxID=1738132 RepID=A0AAD7BQ57_9AGAR|nr:major facilitator superfamily domain-containing protein [Roridomyces roridus]
MTDDARLHSQERLGTKRTPLPRLQLFILLLIQFAEPITAMVIYPFVVQFVRDTGITGGDESKTGFYAGLLESAFFLAESLTVFQFGRLSDIYGRRPVLLLAPIGLCVSMLGFGLSRSFWTLLVFRCTQGAFNGNIGVSKTAMNEISDSTNAADVFSYIPLMWSVGVTLSPFIGGVFANPATKWPDTLGKISLLRYRPYFLPCAIAGFIAFLSFVFAFLGLKETLPSAMARQRKKKSGGETEPLLAETQTETDPEGSETLVDLRGLLTGPVRIALINHGCLSFTDMCWGALLPLVYATPIGMGGLGLKPYDIGLIMGLCGITNAILQSLVGGRVIRYFGPRRVFTASFVAFMITFAAFPVMTWLAARAGRVDGAVIFVLCVQLASSTMLYFAYSCVMLFTMDAAPNKASVGSVTGLAQMVGTSLRSIAPSFASSLFSLSVKNNIAGGYFVYFVLIMVTLGAIRCTLLLPRKMRSETVG